MIAMTPDLVKAHQHDLLVAADRSRRTLRSERNAPRFGALSDLSAVARAAAARFRRDGLVPGPFAQCATC